MSTQASMQPIAKISEGNTDEVSTTMPTHSMSVPATPVPETKGDQGTVSYISRAARNRSANASNRQTLTSTMTPQFLQNAPMTRCAMSHPPVELCTQQARFTSQSALQKDNSFPLVFGGNNSKAYAPSFHQNPSARMTGTSYLLSFGGRTRIS